MAPRHIPWLETSGGLPQGWISAYDLTDVQAEDLYIIRALPAMYHIIKITGTRLSGLHHRIHCLHGLCLRHVGNPVEKSHKSLLGMNSVMALAKMPQVEIADREFDNTCRMTLRTRRDMMDALVAGLGKIDGVTMVGPIRRRLIKMGVGPISHIIKITGTRLSGLHHRIHCLHGLCLSRCCCFFMIPTVITAGW